MENEQGPTASSGSSTGTSNPSTSTSNGRPTVPQISVYSGIPDRQTVQVIQQALHRQPSTAAQYLQQMYAAQQQHLMLQTAALQQQHLSSAQLQSLAAVQQASLAAGRQNSTQNAITAQQTGSSQTTINLATSPAAAQLISRAQSVNSAPAGITQQAVLLGNASSPALSQAQMYLRAQMLIFTPAATVATVQPEATTQTAAQQAATAQVQNLAIRGQQGATQASPSQTQLQGLSLKQAQGGHQLSLASPGHPAVQLKGPAQGGQGPGAATKGGTLEGPLEGPKKGDPTNDLAPRMASVSRTVTAVTNHTLITPAYTQIQPHQLLQQHKQQQQQQFVIQQQPQVSQAQLLQTASIQPHLQALAIQPAVASAPQSQACSVPVLPKLPAPTQQATIFHSTASPQVQPKAPPVQLTAVNLQIQPAPAPTACLVQDTAGGDQPTPLVVRETCPTPSVQQPVCMPTQAATTTEQLKSDSSKLTTQAQDLGAAEGVNAKSSVGTPPAMTSGNGNNAPTVTGSTPQNGESKPPQAIVKPQILTHVIEGFVIQEGAEPFPVERPSLLMENLKKQKQQVPSDPEKPPQSHPTDSEMEDLSQPELKEQEEEPMLKCELCGLVDFASNFKRSKRFCSTVCAKRYSVRCSKRMGLIHPDRSKTEKHKKARSRSSGAQNTEAKKQGPSVPQQTMGVSVSSPLPSQPSQGESSQCSDMSSYEEPPSPLSAASSRALRSQGERGADQGEGHVRELPLLTQHFLPSDPTKWNVAHVYEFICSLPGCQEIAEEFRSQEIDGQALLLLKEDHLMSAMNIKLGPALKIFARISMLKDS
ncbi:polyhomeotic-like protein 2 isoform X1 [Megalops cyprinoides]|uniref:polyhomeotic-like protein 2 isoform X1 n=2 Tax=Megalops cyprinoides TaxID=118141 RepID=UPI00186472B9|nr:polyhomeotic-like protein 2 isoform X1 [Megalops cyprinoides]